MASANIVLDDFISKAADTLENKMENELLIKKRYVKGLRLASITLFGLYLI